MTSPWRIVTRTTGDRPGRPVARACSVRGWLNEELGDDERADELGGEHPLRLVEAARPCGRPAGSGLVDLGVAQLRAHRSRRGPAPPRCGRPPSAPGRARRGSSRTVIGQARARRSGAATRALGGVRSADERRVDAATRAARSATCCAAAIAIAFSVVKSYCGGTAALAASLARRRSGPCSRSRARRGATMSRGRQLARRRRRAAARAGCPRRGSRSARG